MSVVENALVDLGCSIGAILLLTLICFLANVVPESARERRRLARLRREVIRADAAMFDHCLRLSAKHFQAASQLRSSRDVHDLVQ